MNVIRFVRFVRLVSLFFFLVSLNAPLIYAALAPDITQLSLDDLINTEVTSASRTSQPLSQTAAAITVINEEDIRRSGAITVPELLRMVPGLQVAQVNASQWAITARGFNATTANKLLVLIDGRSVYTPLFAGVYWDVQDTLLENIERIEVIRGPNAALWGSNAMNGVINIITKDSGKTQGAMVKGHFGTETQGGGARYGGKITEDVSYRAYGKYYNRDSSYKGNDAWFLSRGGARSDAQINDDNKVMMDVDYYNGEEDVRTTLSNTTTPFTQTILEDQYVAGGHFLTRWNHIYSERSDSSLQFYFDESERESSAFQETRYTGDIDWQHRFLIGDRNEFLWGLGYRLNVDDTDGHFGTYFDPGGRADGLYQLFLQDTFTLIEDKSWLTLGTRFEANEYTGLEIQPTIRLLWQPHPKHTLWSAISRAVSIPSRLDHDLIINSWTTGGSSLLRLEGNSGKDSEAVIAYEAGYRAQVHSRVNFDIAAFINDYSSLRTISAMDRFTEQGYTVTRFIVDDEADAYSIGTELSAKTKVTEDFHFDVGYTFLQMVIDSKMDAFGTARAQQDQNPDHQIFFHPRLNLPQNIEFDTNLRYVDELKNLRTHAYWEMDIRLAWRPTKRIEFSVVGQNLLHNNHVEFPSGNRPEVQRSVYGKTVVEFG
jgi:iron complex outermembrane recepter protein